MGVVAAEVRPDEQRGDPLGVTRGNAEAGEDAGGERFETIGGDGRHGFLPG